MTCYTLGVEDAKARQPYNVLLRSELIKTFGTHAQCFVSEVC